MKSKLYMKQEITTAMTNGRHRMDAGKGKKIFIGKNVSIEDEEGIKRKCDIWVESPGYIADVRIKYSGKDASLYDDSTFVVNIIAVLKKKGYKGKQFFRAELGMQDKNLVVLEPTETFEEFAIKKYGWKPFED